MLPYARLFTLASKPKVVHQGKTIIVRDDDGFLVMLPDGNVKGANTKEQAEKIAKAWYKRHIGSDESIGVGQIEWRDL